METAWKALIDNMRRIREERGLTQAEMAEAVGVTMGSYQRYELGLRSPDPEMIGKIADTLKVTPGALFDGESPAAETTVSHAVEILQAYEHAPSEVRDAVRSLLLVHKKDIEDAVNQGAQSQQEQESEEP